MEMVDQQTSVPGPVPPARVADAFDCCRTDSVGSNTDCAVVVPVQLGVVVVVLLGLRAVHLPQQCSADCCCEGCPAQKAPNSTTGAFVQNFMIEKLELNNFSQQTKF